MESYFEKGQSLAFGEVLFVFDVLGEAGAVAVLADDVDVVGGPEWWIMYFLAW